MTNRNVGFRTVAAAFALVAVVMLVMAFQSKPKLREPVSKQAQLDVPDKIVTQPMPTTALPFTVSVVYSPEYMIDLMGMEKLHPFDIAKYRKIYQALIDDGLLDESSVLAPK